MMLSQKSKLTEDRDKTLSSILYIKYRKYQLLHQDMLL